MKKIISALLALIFIVVLSGCSSSKEPKKYANLDYEDAAIIENTPDTGKWQRMVFEYPGLDTRSAGRIAKVASNFGINVEKNDLQLRLFEDLEDGTELVSVTEEAEAILADYLNILLNTPEEFPYVCMMYVSDDMYIEVQTATGGMMEYDNRKNVNKMLCLDWKDEAPWRPSFNNTKHTEVDLNDEGATCILDGKIVKVVDAVKNAEKYILDNNILFPESFGARVKFADIYSYENTDNQSLSLRFEYTIDGVTLEASPLYAIEDEEGKRYKVRQVLVRSAMLTEDTLDWIWFPVIDGATTFTSEEREIEINRDKACEIVSQTLSQDYVFHVDEIQLMYVDGNSLDGNSYIEPMWRFYITGIEAQEYSRLYVYVSALDGEVNMARAMD